VKVSAPIAADRALAALDGLDTSRRWAIADRAWRDGWARYVAGRLATASGAVRGEARSSPPEDGRRLDHLVDQAILGEKAKIPGGSSLLSTHRGKERPARSVRIDDDDLVPARRRRLTASCARTAPHARRRSALAGREMHFAGSPSISLPPCRGWRPAGLLRDSFISTSPGRAAVPPSWLRWQRFRIGATGRSWRATTVDFGPAAHPANKVMLRMALGQSMGRKGNKSREPQRGPMRRDAL